MTIVGGLIEVILYVQDMDAQVSFYRDLFGLRVMEPQNVRGFAGVYWVTLDTGACTLALHTGGERHPLAT